MEFKELTDSLSTTFSEFTSMRVLAKAVAKPNTQVAQHKSTIPPTNDSRFKAFDPLARDISDAITKKDTDMALALLSGSLSMLKLIQKDMPQEAAEKTLKTLLEASSMVKTIQQDIAQTRMTNTPKLMKNLK